MKVIKKYSDKDLRKAFEAGANITAEFSLPAYSKFKDYFHYRQHLRHGNKKSKPFYKTSL